MQHLSFHVWLVLLSMLSSSSIRVAAKDRISFFYWGWIPFHYTNTPRLLCPLIRGRTFSLFAHLGYFEQCCSEWGCRDLLEVLISNPLYKHPEVGSLDHVVAQFLLFGGNFKLLPMAAVLIYTLTTSAQGFPSLHILTNICYHPLVIVNKGMVSKSCHWIPSWWRFERKRCDQISLMLRNSAPKLPPVLQTPPFKVCSLLHFPRLKKCPVSNILRQMNWQ